MAKGHLRKTEFIWDYGFAGEGSMAAGGQSRKARDHIFNFEQRRERKQQVGQSYTLSEPFPCSASLQPGVSSSLHLSPGISNTRICGGHLLFK